MALLVETKICSDCGEEKPLSLFTLRRRDGDGSREATCKECRIAAVLKFRDQNPLRHSVHNMRRRLKKYGLTEDDYLEMLFEQDSKCAIPTCRAPLTCGMREHIDHTTDSLGKIRVRGILCGGCNPALGKFQHSPAAFHIVAHYLLTAGFPPEDYQI